MAKATSKVIPKVSPAPVYDGSDMAQMVVQAWVLEKWRPRKKSTPLKSKVHKNGSKERPK